MTEPRHRYRPIEKLESGGMAEVFLAESTGMQGFRKQVAIKRVLPHLSEKKKFISMFLDEARLSAHLTHSNCVQVFDIGRGDEAFFIVMEFVDGANLKSIVESLRKQRKELPVTYATFIALEICKGLSYAHELRDPNGQALHIVHRDVSPPNVLITKYGEVKIVDFGLAKANSQLEQSEPGIIKGKFSYLSPEAATGQEVDARTDIFAVGIILWELLAGKRLFLGETDFQTVKQVQQAQVPSISSINAQVPRELERIVAKSLARDPNDRYQTARDLGQDLSQFMFGNGEPVSSFDIGQLVQSVVKDRHGAKAKPKGSIIGALIEEALLEFTSLTDDEKAKSHGADGGDPAARQSTPGAFVDPTNWAVEISGVSGSPGRHAVPVPTPSQLEAGNLSALEDDQGSPDLSPADGATTETPAASPSTPPDAGVMVDRRSAAPAAPPAGSLSAQAMLQAPPSSNPFRRAPSGVQGVIIAIVTAVLAFGAAWYAHLIPH